RWDEVRPDVVHFAYMKATEGGDFRDTQFSKNWKAAKAAGIPRGAYHFFTLKRPGIEQAANYIAVVPKEHGALPPAVDLEFWGNSSARPSIEEFRRELEIFMVEIREHYGREPVIYTDTKFKKHYLKDYPIQRLWIRAVIFTPKQASAPTWMFWQFFEKMKVEGIDGFVDQNVFHSDSESFRRLLQEEIK
ncbi:MAG: GH25 family lysozyme, partial [Verrucomicrobiota bacterium]